VNPLERLHSIESRLRDGAISVDEACTELFTGPKPWQTAWWKTQRAMRIGSECSTCGTAEPPLVLQHTWQPISWKDALRQVGPPNWDWWKEHHPLPQLDRPKQQLIERPVCPRCRSIRVRPRKRTNDWTCQAGQCGAPHERHDDWAFSEPSFELHPDKKAMSRQKYSISAEYQALSSARWQEWLRSPEETVNRLNALRLCITESKRYLSLEDTKTLCKRCAAREDYQHIARSQRDTD
jgi:hypothetical protein